MMHEVSARDAALRVEKPEDQAHQFARAISDQQTKPKLLVRSTEQRRRGRFWICFLTMVPTSYFLLPSVLWGMSTTGRAIDNVECHALC